MISLSDVRGIARGVRKVPRAAVRPLAKIWARRLCGRHNKDIKLFIVGPQGSGKSRSAIYLAIRVSQEIANIIGGKPEDYFPADLSHVFIGDPEAHADALRHIKKHNIYILDDAGVSINARNFMTTYNKSLNDIFQTVRTDNALIIINAPDQFLIDNVPRTLVSHYAEVSESQHSLGFNFLKVFKLERKFREEKTHYHHYQFGNVQVVRWRFGDIPEDMALIYETRRDEATQAIKSNAGRKRQSKEAAMRDAHAQLKEEAHMKAWELFSNGDLAKGKAVARANQIFPGAKITRYSFGDFMERSGFVGI